MENNQSMSHAEGVVTLLTVVLGSAAVGCALGISFLVLRWIAGCILSALRFVRKIIGILVSLIKAPFQWRPFRKAPGASSDEVSKPAKKSSKVYKVAPKIATPKVETKAPKVEAKPPPDPSTQVSMKKLIANAAKSKPSNASKATVRHRLDLNTLKGHTDAITGIAFSPSGKGLATACSDMVVRYFQIDAANSKSYHILRLNVPVGATPVGVAFGGSDDQIVVVSADMIGAGLFMFGPAAGSKPANSTDGKLPPLEIKVEKRQIHERKNVLTCESAQRSSDLALVATCSEGTDIKLWSTKNGNCVATVDTNQLQNTMATISKDGRFLTAAAFTTDVKIWEIRYEKDGQFRDVTKVMLLKGHKSAVTWVCFTSDSQRVITASKDGTLRVWNINVRYQMDEDPKCLKVFPIEAQFDKMAISPDDKVLAVTQGSTLKWLNIENGEVLDTAPNAHESDITSLRWAPKQLSTDQAKVHVLATAGTDKKLKLWSSP